MSLNIEHSTTVVWLLVAGRWFVNMQSKSKHWIQDGNKVTQRQILIMVCLCLCLLLLIAHTQFYFVQNVFHSCREYRACATVLHIKSDIR